MPDYDAQLVDTFEERGPQRFNLDYFSIGVSDLRSALGRQTRGCGRSDSSLHSYTSIHVERYHIAGSNNR